MAWEFTRWWRLLDSNGNLKAETSSNQEIAQFYEDGDIVQRLQQNTKTRWKNEDLSQHFTVEEIKELQVEYQEMIDRDQ